MPAPTNGSAKSPLHPRAYLEAVTCHQATRGVSEHAALPFLSLNPSNFHRTLDHPRDPVGRVRGTLSTVPLGYLSSLRCSLITCWTLLLVLLTTPRHSYHLPNAAFEALSFLLQARLHQIASLNLFKIIN